MTFLRSLGPLALSTLLLARTAAAQESGAAPVVPPPAVEPTPPAAPSSSGSQWYGWQTLASDGATLLSTIALANVHSLNSNGNSAIVLTNLGVGFGLGAPLVHFAHGRPLTALADIAMRVGGVVVGALVGAAAMGSNGDSREDDMGAVVGLLLGGVVGSSAAVVVDATVLSWEKRGPARAATVGQAFTIEPTLGWAPGGGTLGVQGRF
jgi:hypothetical protein